MSCAVTWNMCSCNEHNYKVMWAGQLGVVAVPIGRRIWRGCVVDGNASLTRMLTTGCPETTRVFFHVPSSLWKAVTLDGFSIVLMTIDIVVTATIAIVRHANCRGPCKDQQKQAYSVSIYTILLP